MNHPQELLARYPALAPCGETIRAAFDLLRGTFAAKRKCLLCGNGGSAADAEHWSGELLKGFVRPRPPGGEWTGRLPTDLCKKLQLGLPAIPLTSFLSAGTAFANDVDAELVYAQLVFALGEEGDALVGMSTSGNARNVCRAAEVARAKRMPVLALTGEDGGELARLADVVVRVPERQTLRVQELHLPIYHCLCLMLEDAFFAGGDTGTTE